MTILPTTDNSADFTAGAPDAGQRLDVFLTARLSDYSRSRVQELIRQGHVLVNGRAAKASRPLEPGDQVRVALMPLLPVRPEAEVLPLDIVYEDAALVVVNKPAGLVVHPAPGHARGTLVNALLAHAPELASAEMDQRPGIVHRLDKDTSGLIVIARTPLALACLQRQFSARQVEKFYQALVEGLPAVDTGEIEAPIGRNPRDRQRMAIVARGGREARTRFWVEHRYRRRALLRVQILTGRTHQIRVHLAAIHHPVAGDVVYGYKQEPPPPRLCLHAAELRFRHPLSGEPLAFTAPLPQDMREFLARLEAAH
jgi:23S rRNA pseudouridine1911/1915/1917 synthase